MAGDWSRAEVEATVADYFDMLDHEVRGQDYNKSAHRRRLAALLTHRTDGAIERKHQNISAILIELGFVYVVGYKPLRNYQQLLFETVQNRLAKSQTLADVVRQQVSAPAPVPTVDDILASLVDPPVPDADRARYRPSVTRERLPLQQGVDYLAIEAANRSLGAAGEEFVRRFEVARLVRAGQDRLAARVEQVSATRGDGLGYDVLSFEASGRERFIEVKTTSYGAATPFFVTRRELAVSRDTSEQFRLYRAFNFRRQPRLFCKSGAIDQSFRLEPSQFVATISSP